ncbi:MAG TPA: ABC transporter substrate-binding protein [Casimicrobiaceae bacterium]|nr:ABC transporter substrate-binding protein [Casimicrobiaceae bacterium]
MKRRDCLRFIAASSALGAAPALAQQAGSDDVTAPIRRFYDALLDAMKRAKTLGIKGRDALLAPVISSTFDLAAMTRIAVGPQWTSMPPDLQKALVDAFSRMTIATYASRFDGYSGEKFEIDPNVETRTGGSVVHTQIVQSNGEPVTLNYLMRKSGGAWKIVDVYLTGTISELATRRAEFASILDSGGAQALVASLREQADRVMQPAKR